MIPNYSPWIKQLNRTRPVVPLASDIDTDIVVVGGGISGIVTAYFLLKNTDKRVVLLEADKVAHGATGHNAGQLTSYFERPLFELVEEYGLEMAASGQRAIESGWGLFEEIVNEVGIQTAFYTFMGHAGISDKEELFMHLNNNYFRKKGGLPVESILVAEDVDFLKDIPAEYLDIFHTASHSEILSLLETDNKDYIASLSYKKGCMNSALFTEELVGYLISTYKDRFYFYEGSPVNKINLFQNSTSLSVLGCSVSASKVILCTNGFENFSIINESGPEIDTKFHHIVAGRIGYMSGYVESRNNPPVAISYFPKKDYYSNDPTGDSYFYLTRRPHEHQGDNSYNLICTGGPEKVLPNGALYEKTGFCDEEIRDSVDVFLRNNYNKHPKSDTEYSFCWHGLMGYTPNGIRRIGFEPLNKNLLYNLGCNGVGILPAIFGSHHISRLINGEVLEKTIFDPR
jgi:glycine/D-amino acid oxidase-like deaminating enzyme